MVEKKQIDDKRSDDVVKKIKRLKEEKKTLLNFVDKNDSIIEVIGVGSPIVLLKNSKNKKDVQNASTLRIRYNDVDENKQASVRGTYGKYSSRER